MSGFFIVVSIVWVLAHVFLSRRLVDPSALADRPSTKWAGRALIASLAALPLIALAYRGSATPDADMLSVAGFASMGFSTILIATVVAVDLARLMHHGYRRVTRAPASAVSAADEVDTQRRRFFGDLGRATMVGGAGGLSAIGYVHATRVPPVREVEVKVAGLPAALDGYRIVQLTDIHIGPTIHGAWLRKVVSTVNGLEPDLIAVTGDVVDGLVDNLRSEVAPLAKLSARDGAYYVTGNHEYYWDGKAWSEHFAELGLKVMTNTHALIERAGARVLVGGVTDIRGGARVSGHDSDPHAALAQAPDADLKLLLAHQPRSVFEAAKAGWDLQLSGHTHGGQYLPFSWMIGLFQPYSHGLNTHEGCQIYVSRGTGYWGPPNRFGSSSEISLLTLRSS